MQISEQYYPSYKNKELILDLNLNAFSIYDISGWKDDQTPGLIDYIIYPEFAYDEYEEVVVDSSGIPVTDSNDSIVTVTRTVVANYNQVYNDINNVFHVEPLVANNPRHEVVTFLYFYHYLGNPSWGFSRYTYEGFRDWEELISIGYYGFSYNSYLLTGYNLSGDMARQGQTIYLQTFCRRTEEYYTYVDMMFTWNGGSGYNWSLPSACWVSSQWDWNNSTDQGKWGEEFNTYRFTKPYPLSPSLGDSFAYGDTVIVTKNKLRGRGHALSILFEAEWGKDLKLLGWNALNTKNGEP